jgi:hypothetical protein
MSAGLDNELRMDSISKRIPIQVSAVISPVPVYPNNPRESGIYDQVALSATSGKPKTNSDRPKAVI